MNDTQRLLQKALRRIEPATRYELAKRLGMSQSNLQRAIDGRGHLGPKPALLLATVLGDEPLAVLGLTQADAAKTQTDREFWGRLRPGHSARRYRPGGLGLGLSARLAPQTRHQS
jgi:plasmid maintenance system antidote protein VapI